MFLLINVSLFIMLFVPVTAFSDNCGDKRTQFEMNQCASAEYQQANTELNRLYNTYRSRLDKDQKRRIRDVQLAWVKFRDLACNFESSGVKGGSVYPFIMSSCLTTMTRERLDALSELADCEEGDLSCPAPK